MGAYGSPDTFPYDKMEKKCPKCGKMVEGKFCPECGARLYKEKKKLGIKQGTTQSGNVIDITLLCIGIGLGAIGAFGGGEFNTYNLLTMVFFAALVCFVGFIIKAIVFAITKTQSRGTGRKILLSFIVIMIVMIIETI